MPSKDVALSCRSSGSSKPRVVVGSHRGGLPIEGMAMQKGVAVALMLIGTAGPIWRLAHLKAPGVHGG
jgi:hypothetical protein